MDIVKLPDYFSKRIYDVLVLEVPSNTHFFIGGWIALKVGTYLENWNLNYFSSCKISRFLHRKGVIQRKRNFLGEWEFLKV